MGFRVEMDDSDRRPGEKYYYWEMKGVPIRLELGAREAENSQITIFRRDTKEKSVINTSELEVIIKTLGREITENLKELAFQFFKEHLAEAKNIDELVEHLENRKMVKIPYCTIELEGEDCANEIKDRFAGAQVRGIDVEETKKPKKNTKCFICGKPATCFVYVGKQY